jgi:endoglucanase
MNNPLHTLILALLLCSTPSLSGQANPAKLASAARIDLNAAPAVGALHDAAITDGSGGVDRQTWLPESEWPLTYMIHVPIVRFAWNTFTLRFVPDQSGPVYLSLRGPWEEVTPGIGPIYKQEVLWDALEIAGASLLNGSFEIVNGDIIAGWNGGLSQSATDHVPAVEGNRMARTWHDGSMSQELRVSAGVPVELRFFARAVVPDGFADMQPITARDTPAHRTALKFMRGVNFGNSLEMAPGTPGRLDYDAVDFARARAEGFDHIRLPVGWHFYCGPGPDFAIASDIYEQVNSRVALALAEGLAVMIDVHHFEEFTSDPPAHLDQFYAIWEQLAVHYADAPSNVVFELLNEPRDAATTTVMNPIFAEAIRRIRVTNPNRTLFIGTGDFNGISELNHLLLPDDDLNLIATVHTYDPFLFTHQGLDWAGDDAAAIDGIQFPGPPSEPLAIPPGVSQWAANWIHDYNSLPTERNPGGPAGFRGALAFARQWSDHYGRPVHIGEFGAFSTIDAASRVAYYTAMRQALDELELGWAIWDWNAGFRYWHNDGPEPSGLREALFPPPVLQSPARGVVEFPSSLGKQFVIERSTRFTSPLEWQPIFTVTPTSPRVIFLDPEVDQHPAALYRAVWLK